jgi:carboxypeptidase C (cathepsin A)
METYAGLIPIKNEKHTNNERKHHSGEMFFWYFPVQNESLKSTAPLIVWLQGGRMF